MSTQQQHDLWTYRGGAALGADIVGFKVEALDGSIGKIDNATGLAGNSSIVVDTGPWIFGRKVMLPAGVIDRIDVEDERVHVNRTKDQIKAAPEFDDSLVSDDAYREQLGGHYGEGGAGWTAPRVLP